VSTRRSIHAVLEITPAAGVEIEDGPEAPERPRQALQAAREPRSALRRRPGRPEPSYGLPAENRTQGAG
jgi:hypothetical protein